MAENTRTENAIIATDGSFAQGLKMPMLNAAFMPGRRPGDFGLFSNKVYVRLQDQTVIELKADTDTNGPWSVVLAAGNTSGANNAVMSAGQSLTFVNGIQIGNGSGLPTAALSTGIAIGSGTTTSVGSNSMALGTGAGAVAGFSTAIGANAVVAAPDVNSTALGYFATSTKAFQIMIGNSVNGGTEEIFCDVGPGVVFSSGYFAAGQVVHARISAAGGQPIAPGLPGVFTQVLFPTIFPTADFGTPDISSTPDNLVVRFRRVMTGTTQLELAFPVVPVGDSQLTVRVRKDDGVAATISKQTYVVQAGTPTVSIVIPYFVSAVVANTLVFVEIDNPTAVIFTIDVGSDLEGVYSN